MAKDLKKKKKVNKDATYNKSEMIMLVYFVAPPVILIFNHSSN